jgi:two-component system chemotaxis response regulator CheY
MKILIVDDDEFSRTILSDILRDIGQCDMACNGYEAIDAFMQAGSDGAPYDLICLDLIMPEIDGLQVLRQIRTIEERESIDFADSVKVVMVSSMSDFEHIMMSFDSRRESYLLKPCTRQQLLEQLTAFGLGG